MPVSFCFMCCYSVGLVLRLTLLADSGPFKREGLGGVLRLLRDMPSKGVVWPQRFPFLLCFLAMKGTVSSTTFLPLPSSTPHLEAKKQYISPPQDKPLHLTSKTLVSYLR